MKVLKVGVKIKENFSFFLYTGEILGVGGVRDMSQFDKLKGEQGVHGEKNIFL